MTSNPRAIDGRTAALSALAIVLMVAMVVAWRIDAEATTSPPEVEYQLTVVNEQGEPVGGALVEFDGRSATTGPDGTIRTTLRSPELAIVSATGMLPDAIVIGSPDAPQASIELLATMGPGGTRTVMHFAGDYMMGRRYLSSEDTEPLVADGDDARDVVSDIASLFSLADLSTVNFESVIGTLSFDDAYQGKRYLLQSPPYTMSALDELGVDLVTLGNNHINDWLDAGLASTVRNLDSAGIAHTGAGLQASEAVKPAVLSAGTIDVGIVSMTTVTGDYVNDSLPDATAPEPATIVEQDRWQYELREFGFGEDGDPTHVPLASRRPGTMWRLFEAMEPEITASDSADLWRELTRVYPELQDWVARRGHGGAAHYSREAVETAVETARTAGADLVVVQLHGGYQFADVSSDYFGKATRAAVDAGADLVVGHHPHVLQGFEIYNDTLIAYSLGNFVFDQDFLSTHPSAVLRTVFEGEQLISATVYPVILDDYRPVVASGDVAAKIIRQMNEASLQNAESLRLPDRRIGSTPTDAPVTATVTMDDGRGIISLLSGPADQVVDIDAAVPLRLDSTLVRNDDAVTGLEIGRDVFGYGSLEDYQADGEAVGGLEWSVPPHSLEIDPTSPEGPWVVRLDRTSQHVAEAVARTAARVSLADHRWFAEDGAPVDGTATHSVRVWAKRVGAGIPFVRAIYYEFDDTDPTREPDSTALETIDIELPLVNDGQWHELWVDLPMPPADANTALIGVGLAPPESQSGTVWVDGLEVIEWRHANESPNGVWMSVDYLRSNEFTQRTLTIAAG